MPMYPGRAAAVDSEWLERRCREAGLRSVERTLAGMIRDGELPQGTRLPTIRETARLLGLSPGTIAAIWKRLGEDGLIETNRRGGTIVLEARRQSPEVRFLDDWMSFDLAHGGPDPKLQPEFEEAMLAGLKSRNLPSPPRETITAQLIDAVAPTWPFAPESWSTTGGGTEGIYLALEAVANGRPIAVEQPTSPRLVEAIHTLGLRAIAVQWDKDGPEIASLREALSQGPAAFIYQPRAHLPTGRSVTPDRMSQMVECFRQYLGVDILEDDGLGPLSTSSVGSLGSHFPERVLYVRTYCKAYGIDLKVCVVGGSRRLVQRVNLGRSHGTGITSRILQGALAHLLGSSASEKQIRAAQRRYTSRRTMLANAIREHGLEVDGDAGFLLWLPVPDEAAALVNLSSRGIAAGPGSHCCVVPARQGHLWLTTSRIPENRKLVAELASIIATSVSGTGVRGYD